VSTRVEVLYPASRFTPPDATLKKIVKRLFRPFARPFLRRIDARIKTSMEDAEALKAYIPVLLNAISTQNAAARESRRVEDRLEQRIAQLETRLGGLTQDAATEVAPERMSTS